MRYRKATVIAMAGAMVVVATTLLFLPKGERQTCVSRQPMANGTAGYELIDMLNREVWATRDFVADAYEALSFPTHWLFWFKNGPRILLADSGTFLKSPGCSRQGEFTYLHAFDRAFLKVVELDGFRQLPADAGRLIRRVELQKYHVLTYREGRTVSVLRSPEGERFIGVSRGPDSSSNLPTLPAGWTLREHVLTEDLHVKLLGTVSVLRVDNEDSYQGPLPAELRFDGA